MGGNVGGSPMQSKGWLGKGRHPCVCLLPSRKFSSPSTAVIDLAPRPCILWIMQRTLHPVCTEELTLPCAALQVVELDNLPDRTAALESGTVDWVIAGAVCSCLQSAH